MQKTKIDIGPKVRAYRNAREWSRRQLSEKAGVSGQLIWLIERGEGNPSLSTVADIARALDVNLKDLIA